MEVDHLPSQSVNLLSSVCQVLGLCGGYKEIPPCGSSLEDAAWSGRQAWCPLSHVMSARKGSTGVRGARFARVPRGRGIHRGCPGGEKPGDDGPPAAIPKRVLPFLLWVRVDASAHSITPDSGTSGVGTCVLEQS